MVKVSKETNIVFKLELSIEEAAWLADLTKNFLFEKLEDENLADKLIREAIFEAVMEAKMIKDGNKFGGS